MKCIQRILIIFLLSQLRSTQALPKQALMLFLRDFNTGQVVYDTPIQATYAGYFTNSNHNGQLILPRKTQALDFHLLITNHIEPVFSILNNVSHLLVPTYEENKLYHIRTNLNANNTQEWLVTLEDLPADRHIPLHTIVILSDPNNLSMQVGTSPMQISSHLILPSLYLTEPLINIELALYLPNNRPFLGKLQTAYSLTPYGYATLQTS